MSKLATLKPLVGLLENDWRQTEIRVAWDRGLHQYLYMPWYKRDEDSDAWLRQGVTLSPELVGVLAEALIETKGCRLTLNPWWTPWE